MKTTIMNQIKAAQYQIELNKLSDEIELTINKNEMYMGYIDIAYENKSRDLQLIRDINRKTDELLDLINKINVIGLNAIKIKDNELLMKCECKKAKLIMLMEYMINKYI